MSRIGSVAIILAASLAAPLPALAQGGQGQGPGRGMGARLLVEQGSVEYLVTRAAELHLTDEQKAQLTTIGAAWSDSTKAAREQVAAAMPARGQAGGGDRQAMMQRMQELRPVMEKLRADDERSVEAALKVLDEHQQATARTLLEERARSAMPRRGG